MTKLDQKAKEERVIQRLLKHLANDGVEILYEPEKMEAPDFKLFIDNKIIGCELTRITLEELEKWGRGQESRIEKAEKEILKNRADEWMEALLERKTKKVANYRINCACDELWLVIHFGIIPIFGHGIRNFERMQKTIKRINHHFDKIWFVGDKTDVRQLWPIEDQTY